MHLNGTNSFFFFELYMRCAMASDYISCHPVIHQLHIGVPGARSSTVDNRCTLISYTHLRQAIQIHRHAPPSSGAAAAKITPSILTPALSIFRPYHLHLSHLIFAFSLSHNHTSKKTIKENGRPHSCRQPRPSSCSPSHLRLLHFPPRHFLQLGQNFQV